MCPNTHVLIHYRKHAKCFLLFSSSFNIRIAALRKSVYMNQLQQSSSPPCLVIECHKNHTIYGLQTLFLKSLGKLLPELYHFMFLMPFHLLRSSIMLFYFCGTKRKLFIWTQVKNLALPGPCIYIFLILQ